MVAMAFVLAQQAADPTSTSTFATSLVAGAFTVLGVIITLTGTLLSNRQNAKHNAEVALRMEQREVRRQREREVRERAANVFGALQHLVDAEVTLGLAEREPESKRLIELRLAAQGAFDSFVFVAPAKLTLAADEVWQAYEQLHKSEKSSSTAALSYYYRARYKFANDVRAQYDLDSLPTSEPAASA
jgi:hypothetical protein